MSAALISQKKVDRVNQNMESIQKKIDDKDKQKVRFEEDSELVSEQGEDDDDSDEDGSQESQGDDGEEVSNDDDEEESD